MPEGIRVALVNDYEIVLEGLRAILRPYCPEICVVEFEVEGSPERALDVTLFDTNKRCVNACETSLLARTARSLRSASRTTQPSQAPHYVPELKVSSPAKQNDPDGSKESR